MSKKGMPNYYDGCITKQKDIISEFVNDLNEIQDDVLASSAGVINQIIEKWEEKLQ